MTHQTPLNQISLRAFARAHVHVLGKEPRTNGRYDRYPTWYRGGNSTNALSVSDKSWRDHARPDLRGGIIKFAIKVLQVASNVAEAYSYINQWAGGVDLSISTRRQNTPIENPADPPPAAWQREMAAALDRHHVYLMSKAPDAQRARAWLHARGITDDLIVRFKLGYNPRWHKTGYVMPETDADGGKRRVSIPPGITIGWFADGALWAIHVRCREAKLAAALGIQPDRSWDKETGESAETDKYKYVLGSKITGALFNGDVLQQQDQPALFVEGEFDAIIAAATLDGVNVVTLGGASTHLAARWRRRIAGAAFVCLDNDEAGRDGATALLKCLPSNAQRIELPAEKDITDFVTSGGDLPAWFAAATARRSAAAQSGAGQPVASVETSPGTRRYFLPYTWRRGIVMINTSGTREKTTGNLGLLLECVIFRGVRDKALNPAGMTFEEVAAYAHQHGIELADRQLRRVFDELKKVFMSPTDIGIVDDSVSLDDINSPRRAGRPAQRWKLNELQTAKTALAREMSKKVMERHFAAEGGVIPPLGVLLAALRDNDLPNDDAVISSLKQALEAAGDLDKTTAQKLIADTVADRLIKSLDDLRGEPIPADFPMKTGEDYLAAHGTLRLKADYHGNVFLSQKQIGDDLGITSRKVVARLTKRIGIVVQPSGMQEVTLTRDRRIYEQVESVRSKVKGKALSLKAVRRDGTIIRENYSIAAAQRFLNEGAAVTVAIRTANMYSVTPDIRPIEAAPRVVKPAQQQQEQPPVPRTPVPVVEIERDDPDRIGHSRVWLRDQLALILSRLDKFEARGDKLINRETGEIISRNAPVSTLLYLLIGREVESVETYNYAADELFAFALREWGDSVRGVKLG